MPKLFRILPNRNDLEHRADNRADSKYPRSNGQLTQAFIQDNLVLQAISLYESIDQLVHCGRVKLPRTGPFPICQFR
jgi:hypothetical protein